MEFTPLVAGKHQSVTYNSVKEHILQEIQKDLKNGSDMSVNLRKDNDSGIPNSKPNRVIAKKIKNEEDEESDDPMDLKIEQEGLDMEYTIDLKEWKARQNVYKENNFKAYAIIFGYCNKTMQNRIEETSGFEEKIRNDPFLLLETIKLKMYELSMNMSSLLTHHYSFCH